MAVVTGRNKGIGFALVKRLAELGLTLVLTARYSEDQNYNKILNSDEKLKAVEDRNSQIPEKAASTMALSKIKENHTYDSKYARTKRKYLAFN